MQQPSTHSFAEGTAPPSSPPTPRRRPRVDSTNSQRSGPESKRIRSSGSPTASSRPAMMSAKSQGKRPEVIDLTNKPSAFQPLSGAKKLVIKNLRPANRTVEVDEFYRRTRTEIDDALGAMLRGRRPNVPLETIYRGVEDMCRNGQGERLYDLLCKRCEEYLKEVVLNETRTEGAGSNAEMLRSVYRHWSAWNTNSITIRSTFSYLDRSYLLTSKKHAQINDMLIAQFRKIVFGNESLRPGFSSRESTASSPGPMVLSGMSELVDYCRRGDARFDSSLLLHSVTMLHILNIYGKAFEPRFLKDSRDFFEEFAGERSVSHDLKDYISACKDLIKCEAHRCQAYNLDSSTKQQLLDDAQAILVDKYTSKLLDSGNVGKLLDANEVESIKALYDLLRQSGIQKRLKEPWEDYIGQTGSEIVNDTVRGEDMIVRLLQLRRTLDVLVRDAFYKDDDFTYGLREAFGRFINDRKIASSWNTGTSKVGEMIAKYIDLLLRGGLKAVPQSLLSDKTDRSQAERSGQARTGDEDAELDRQLDQALELFRFIEGKDVFEAFYKKDLARRLLMGRSASQDAERNMLTKLKSECGSSFTHNLEQMFKDQELGRDEMDSYKEWQEGKGNDKGGVDLSVSILSEAAWPSYPDVKMLLPPDVARKIEQFDTYYKTKHEGRKLKWKHALAHCVVRASFDKGPKELLVSAFQAVVLVLFNQAPEGVLGYDQIAHSTGLQPSELDRTLQSLACGRVRVLTKHPKGREVSKTDTFSVNRSFWDPKYRVKINQIQLKETKEENLETHQRVSADRQFETQAAIVRIMKSRRIMTHPELVAEVINQTKSRGAVDAPEIKKNIEKLIEKEYLERVGSQYSYVA